MISCLSPFDTNSKSLFLGLNGPTGTLSFGWDVLDGGLRARDLCAGDPPAAAADGGGQHVGDMTQEAEEEDILLGVGRVAA